MNGLTEPIPDRELSFTQNDRIKMTVTDDDGNIIAQGVFVLKQTTRLPNIKHISHDRVVKARKPIYEVVLITENGQ